MTRALLLHCDKLLTSKEEAFTIAFLKRLQFISHKDPWDKKQINVQKKVKWKIEAAQREMLKAD